MYYTETDKILMVLDNLGAISPETGITTEQMVEKGIELGLTQDVFTQNWHGHKEGDHPWWLLLAAMSGTGSEVEVAKYNVPGIHRKKIKGEKNGRTTTVYSYWYDESFNHEIHYTGKAYRDKVQREEYIKKLLQDTKNLPRTKEDRIAQLREQPDVYLELDGKFYLKKFILEHPEKFNPVIVKLAEK